MKSNKKISGSNRDKNKPTKKRNKWNDLFWVRAVLLKPGKGILKTEYSRIVKEKRNEI